MTFVIHNSWNTAQNYIVNDKKGHNIVNDSFALKPDGLHVKQGMIHNRSFRKIDNVDKSVKCVSFEVRLSVVYGTVQFSKV